MEDKQVKEERRAEALLASERADNSLQKVRFFPGENRETPIRAAMGQFVHMVSRYKEGETVDITNQDI